ncbi:MULTISPECIES: thiamine pyrophosphate-binding protein [Dickeya]|uniref:thiamine pyrophosphate-binding protein n=1 Tax=Dickeya TaxID=204037 RepID=UPI0031666EBA
MNVAAYIAKFLVDKHVRHVFGYQGGAILKLLDEMVATGQIQYIQNYHEQASALAADAYARVTDTIGVALATSGPGATNLITGIANAQFDSIPTLFITGQDYLSNVRANNHARQNGFQDLDVVKVVQSITKYSAMLDDPLRVRYELEKAYWYATSGRPGAVLLDVPIDIQFKEIEPEQLEGFVPDSEPTYDTDFEKILPYLKNSSRPVILVGGGVRISKAVEEVREFIKLSHIPVVSTVNGLDVVEGIYGFAGLHGHTHANLAMQNADLIIALGVRFGQRQVGKVPAQYTNAKVIHVDIDENELKRIFPDEIAIQSDIKSFLKLLNVSVSSMSFPHFNNWHEQIQKWSDKYKENTCLTRNGIEPVKFIERLIAQCPQNTIFTNDVGQNQMWVSQAFKVKNGQRLLNSCGHGTMGYSLPASIGAKVAHPDKTVVCFTGDGGLQMNLQELVFVGHKKLGIKCVVFNNRSLGMMREVQERYYNSHYYGNNENEFTCVNLEKLADTCDINYCCINSLEDVDNLEGILNDNTPYIVEVCLSRETMLSNRYDEADIFKKEVL